MCTAERDNLRLAFDWAVTRDDAEAVLRLFRATGMFSLLSGAIDEGQRWGAGCRRRRPAGSAIRLG